MDRHWLLRGRAAEPTVSGIVVFVLVPVFEKFGGYDAAYLVVCFQGGEITGGTGQVFEEAFDGRSSRRRYGEVARGPQD